MMAALSASEVKSPRFIVPRQRRLTFRPVRPSCVYCMMRPPDADDVRCAVYHGTPRRTKALELSQRQPIDTLPRRCYTPRSFPRSAPHGIDHDRSASNVPHDAPDPPLRGARHAILPERPDSRVVSSLHRPGGDRSRRVRRAAPRRLHDLHLSRPRPVDRQRPRSQRGDGRAAGPAHRLQPGQGRLDALHRSEHRSAGRERHRRRGRADRRRRGADGAARQDRSGGADLLRRRRGQPGRLPGDDESRRHLEAARDLLLREQPLLRDDADPGDGGAGAPDRARRWASACRP